MTPEETKWRASVYAPEKIRRKLKLQYWLLGAWSVLAGAWVVVLCTGRDTFGWMTAVVLLAGYANQAYQGMGDPYMLPVITAVVIGGTSIMGGQGGYGGTIVGADVVKRVVKPGDIIIIPAGVPHGWSDIADHVDYLSIRPDPDRVLKPYVNPAVQKK